MQNPELELQYKSCYARILDAKRRFLEAATRYYDLSQSSSGAADAPKVSRSYRCILNTALLYTVRTVVSMQTANTLIKHAAWCPCCQ